MLANFYSQNLYVYERKPSIIGILQLCVNASRGSGLGPVLKLFRAVGVVSAMTLLSRLLGFVRDMVIAVQFGASGQTDAFLAAFKIPNYFRRLFAEGSFALAFVPVLARIREQGDARELKLFIDHVTTLLLGALLAVTALGVLGAPWLLRVFTPGFVDEPDKFQSAVDMTRITFPYLMWVSLAGLAGGILNTFERFALPALSPVLLNLSLIVAALGLSQWLAVPVHALAWGVFAGGLLQMLLVFPPLWRMGLFPRLRFGIHPGVRRVLRLMVPTLLGSSVAQVNLLVDTLVASFLVSGSMTWLYLADRMMELPLGVFGVALSVVILPALSRHFAAGRQGEYLKALAWAMESGLLVALPAAMGLFVLAEPIMIALFQYRNFTAGDARMAALALQLACFGLPLYVLVKVMAPAFYAREDTRTPVRIAVWAMTVNMVLNVLFLLVLAWWRYPGEWPGWVSFWLWLQQQPGLHVALVAAGVVSGLVNSLLLWRALRDRLGAHALSRVFLMRLLGATLVMGLVLWLARGELPAFHVLPMGARLAGLAALVGLGAMVFLLVLWGTGYRWQRPSSGD